MNQIPETSRAKHNKKHSPKGGKGFWAAFASVASNPAVKTVGSQLMQSGKKEDEKKDLTPKKSILKG